MTLFMDYNQVLIDMAALITTANLGFIKVFKNANNRDYTLNNMPLCDLHLKLVEPDNTGQQNYYVKSVVEIKIAVGNLSSRDAAATIRDQLAGSIQRLFQTNPRFGAYCDATQIGPAVFATDEDKAQGAFVAGAALEINVFAYSNG